LDAAEAALGGQWPIFTATADISGPAPDWFRDPATGRHAPAEPYAFNVGYRDQDRVGNIKYLWEVSRLHHLTVLAAGYHLGCDDGFAERALAHLTSWWNANPPLTGVHWVSGIEIGMRLIAWVWVRRLLGSYPGVAAAFEENPVFQRQLHAHQSWLATFHSRGTSANNHLIAEMVGQLAASLAFPLFAESPGWAIQASAVLEREVAVQTFPDGLNRELAADYHVYVLELFLVAGIEADAAGAPLGDGYWRRLRDMADALAATVDAGLHTARQGDGDDARALLLDAPSRPAIPIVLELCASLFGAAPWWPAIPRGSVTTALVAGLARHRGNLPGPPRSATRPSTFPAAGITILRDPAPDHNEIWCRFDHGPHGFLATAAHAHADALSLELRLGGQQILVDPGTYCYHGEPKWRNYFRSTIAHNALELEGRDQAVHAGPFLWLRWPNARLIASGGLQDGDQAMVEASHDGYAAGLHRRKLILDRGLRSLAIHDMVDSEQDVPVRLAFTLHPDITCTLRTHQALLSWPTADGDRHAALSLPPELTWTAHKGETDPILGWYSPGFGAKQPATLLLGRGTLAPGQTLRSQVSFGHTADIAWSEPASAQTQMQPARASG
jgi:hypothetical protein